MLKHYIELVRNHIKPKPILLICIGCIGIYAVLYFLTELSRKNNQAIIYYDLPIDRVGFPVTHYYNDLLNISFYEAMKCNRQGEKVNRLLTTNSPLRNALHDELSFNSLYMLYPYLHKIGYFDLEKQSVITQIADNVDSIISNEQGAGFYYSFFENYLSRVYLESIKDEWEYGNYYTVYELARMLKVRYEQFRFDSFDRLNPYILRANNKLFLVLLASSNPRLMCLNRELGHIIGRLIFNETMDRSDLQALHTSKVPEALKPLKEYISATSLLRDKRYKEACQAFQQIRLTYTNEEYRSYAFFMECRCLFWLYDSTLKIEYLDLLNAHHHSAMAAGLNPNLRIDLDTYVGLANNK